MPTVATADGVEISSKDLGGQHVVLANECLPYGAWFGATPQFTHEIPANPDLSDPGRRPRVTGDVTNSEPELRPGASHGVVGFNQEGVYAVRPDYMTGGQLVGALVCDTSRQ